MPVIGESTAKNAKSIDDLIESLNNTTETPKSSSRKKYEWEKIVFQVIWSFE